MNENEFELDGKVYVRIPNSGCANCCFNCADSGGKCLQMPCIHKEESYKEKEMTYCHISTQCDIHAEEEGRKQALEDEIERVADDLLWKLPEWVITDETYILERNEAERIIKLKIRGIE